MQSSICRWGLVLSLEQLDDKKLYNGSHLTLANFPIETRLVTHHYNFSCTVHPFCYITIVSCPQTSSAVATICKLLSHMSKSAESYHVFALSAVVSTLSCMLAAL